MAEPLQPIMWQSHIPRNRRYADSFCRNPAERLVMVQLQRVALQRRELPIYRYQEYADSGICRTHRLKHTEICSMENVPHA